KRRHSDHGAELRAKSQAQQRVEPEHAEHDPPSLQAVVRPWLLESRAVVLRVMLRMHLHEPAMIDDLVDEPLEHRPIGASHQDRRYHLQYYHHRALLSSDYFYGSSFAGVNGKKTIMLVILFDSLASGARSGTARIY